MARTVTDSRQIILRQFLEQIGNRTHHDGTSDAKPANVSELDNLLASIDLDLTPPLRLDASNPVDLTVSVGSGIVTNTETNRNRSIPHVGSLLPNFASGTVTFPSTSGGTITCTPGNNNTLTVPSNEYIKVLIYLDANGDLNVLPGVSNAVEADATVLPPPTNTLPIGYVTLFNNAGTIDNVEQAKIYQFGTGAGGGGGAGNANEFVETTKNRLNDSIFEAATPYVAETDQDDTSLVDTVNSTGAFDLVTSLFSLPTVGNTLQSANLLDTTFLDGSKGINAVEALIKYDPDGIDAGATYELTRNGGNEWQDVSANVERIDDTGTFRVYHEFDKESANQTILEYAVSNADATEVLTDTVERIGQIFTVANLAVIRDIELYLNKTGTPAGNYYVSIVRDDAGSPSTDPSDVLYESSFQPISDLSAGNNTINLETELVLGADDYHVVISTDQTYKDDYAAAVDQIAVRTDGSTPSIPDLQTFSSSTWGAVSGESMTYKLDGIELDLRLRITSSVADVLVEAFAVLYEQNLGNLAVATTVEGITKVSFQAVADNLNSFTLPFLPNPELLVVYLLGSGQSFRFGDFSLQGNTVVFPVDQFNNGGVEKGQTLIFDQIRGGAFDNSDVNAALLAGNHLGSTDGSFDKSVAGRGIFLRRPDGTLREITINDDDEIEIFSV